MKTPRLLEEGSEVGAAGVDVRPILDLTALRTGFSRRGIGIYLRGLLHGFTSLGVPIATWGFAAREAPRTPDYPLRQWSESMVATWLQLSMQGRWTLPTGTLPHFTSLLASGIGMDAPYLTTVYDLIPRRFPQHYLRTPWRRWFYTRYLDHLRGASHLIAISQAVKEEVVEVLGRRPEEVTVAAPGTPLLPPVPEPADGTPYLFVAGAANPHKNLGFVVEVMADLSPALRVPLVVSGFLRDRRWEGIRSLALLRGVELALVGEVDRMCLARLYGGATAVLVPSLYEGFGLPVLEALSVGARVICSDRGGLPEAAGQAARVVPLKSAAWREALLEALEGRTPHDGVAARSWASRFTWEDTARAVLGAYRRLT